MRTESVIICVLTLIFVYYLLSDTLIYPIGDRKHSNKHKKAYAEKFQTQVIGEVVGEEYSIRYALLFRLLGIFLRRSRGLGEYQIFCPIVRYTIGDCTYEIDAGIYTIYHAKIGQKVTVIYNPENHMDIYVQIPKEEQQCNVKVTTHPVPLVAWCKARDYKAQIVGEVVGSGKRKRSNLYVFLLGPDVGMRKKYSPIVRYTVGDTIYEIDARDYSEYPPIVGRKALVWCKTNDPEKAYVPIWRRYRKDLLVKKRDEDFIYCAYGLRKNIKIPIGQVEENAYPGRRIVQKYGFYHLKQPEEMKKSYLESMADVIGKKFDDYK